MVAQLTVSASQSRGRWWVFGISAQAALDPPLV